MRSGVGRRGRGEEVNSYCSSRAWHFCFGGMRSLCAANALCYISCAATMMMMMMMVCLSLFLAVISTRMTGSFRSRPEKWPSERGVSSPPWQRFRLDNNANAFRVLEDDLEPEC